MVPAIEYLRCLHICCTDVIAYLSPVGNGEIGLASFDDFNKHRDLVGAQFPFGRHDVESFVAI